MRRSRRYSGDNSLANSLRLWSWAILSGIFAWGIAAQPATAQGQPQPDGLQVLQSFEQVLVSVIDRCEDSVVAIARVRKDDVKSGIDPTDPDFVPHEYATGVVVDGDGLILTNFHVMREDCDYWITTSKRGVYKVTDWWGDERLDLAVLKTDANNLRPIEFGDADDLRKGNIVIALGNPYAIARDGEVCASWGIISNLKRKPADRPRQQPTAPLTFQEPGQSQDQTPPVSDKPTIHHYGTLIYSDVRLERGTSGGALLDLKGRLIGLTTALADHVGYAESAGYAIALDTQMQAHVETLKRGGEIELGYLGIHVENQSERIRRSVPGVQVTGTVFGTSADRAGLKPGDVITAIDGNMIYNTDELFTAFRKRSVGDEVRIVFERDSRHQQVQIALDKAPPSGRQRYVERPLWRGLRVDHASVLIQSGFGRGSEASEGVAITHVERDSPAWRAGLRSGMIITSVKGSPVSQPDNCSDAFLAAVGDVVMTVDAPAGDDAGEYVIQP